MIRRTRAAVILLAMIWSCAKKDKSAGPAGAGDTTASATLAASRPVTMPANGTEWERFNYDSSVIAPAALASLPLVDVQRIRGIIFGRHGRVFQDSSLQTWLETRQWYHPDTAFTNARLTPIDRANLEIVRAAEAQKHPQIEPGDMRFYQARVITTAMLGDHSPQDWEVLEAEVLANHGFVFDTESETLLDRPNRNLSSYQLQQYFDERYWYRPNAGFEADQLSTTERQNLDTIAVAQMRQNRRSVSFGMMNLFQSTPLTDHMLDHVPIGDLRLLRNEIYARRGRRFQTQWIADAFRQQPWYTPRAEYTDADLTGVDSANIKLITHREEQLHQALSTQLLTLEDVRGLRPDDARRLRNEIYARHGRRFQDPKLERYFASFSWYKPNADFRESQLNTTEKANALLISQFEHRRFTEG
jgi:hypothetical protein